MIFKNKKTLLSMATVLSLSLGLMACGRQNTNPPSPNRTGTTGINQNNTTGRDQTALNGTGQSTTGLNQYDGRGTDLMGVNPDGTVRNDGTTGLNPNGKLGTTVGNNQTNTTGLNEGFQQSTVRDDHPNDNNNSLQRAQNIENAVNSVSGVRSSRVIISNNRALVGVDMAAGAQGNATTTLRNSVERAVKNADSGITTVAVSADPDIFRRITNVGNGIRGGRPFSQFGAEIEEIFNRIIPR